MRGQAQRTAHSAHAPSLLSEDRRQTTDTTQTLHCRMSCCRARCPLCRRASFLVARCEPLLTASHSSLLTAHCLQPSACTPTPISSLLALEQIAREAKQWSRSVHASTATQKPFDHRHPMAGQGATWHRCIAASRVAHRPRRRSRAHWGLRPRTEDRGCAPLTDGARDQCRSVIGM